MRAAAVALGCLAVLGCGAPPLEDVTEEGADLAALLPDPPPGWVLVEGPDEYTVETLYEYLDGGAERILGHGFHRLLHVRYSPPDAPLGGLTVDLFDMGSDLGAFGLYRDALPPAPELRPWGAEGHRDGALAAAWRGSLLIRAEADDDRPESIALLEALVADVASRAPGPAALPGELAALPTSGLVPFSERRVPGDLGGHAFLPGGLTADYELDGARARLLLCDLPDAAAAAEVFVALRDHHGRRGELADGAPGFGDQSFRFASPVLGEGTAMRAGIRVAWVQGDLAPEAREAILAGLDAASR